jgi:hypothetical protein
MGFRGQFAQQHPEPPMSALGQKQTFGSIVPSEKKNPRTLSEGSLFKCCSEGQN